eukprot:38548_1
MVWLLLFMISGISNTHSVSCTSKTSTQCNIHCNGTVDCRNQLLDCNLEGTGLDCVVDCSHGCSNVTIHAEHANHLYIKNCNHDHDTDDIYCTHMNIFCPQHIETRENSPICIIEGDSDHFHIESTNIFTKQGFNDFELRYIRAINTKVYCGETASEYWCNIDETRTCDASGDLTCNDLSFATAHPTMKPTIIAIEEEETRNPTMSINEGEIEYELTTTTEMDLEDAIIEYTVIHAQSTDVNLQIVILSGVCLLLLVCCVMFCTLWMMKKYQTYTDTAEHEYKQKCDALALSKDLNTNKNDTDQRVNDTTQMYVCCKPRMGSIFSDNLSVITMSNGHGMDPFPPFAMQSPSMKHSLNEMNMISPFHSNMVSVCNSAIASDWETDHDDVMSDQTAGEGQNNKDMYTHIRPDEFIVQGEEDEDTMTPPGCDRKRTLC